MLIVRKFRFGLKAAWREKLRPLLYVGRRHPLNNYQAKHLYCRNTLGKRQRDKGWPNPYLEMSRDYDTT